MTNAFLRFLRPRPLLVLAGVVGLILLVWPARTGRSDNFVLYLPNASHILPITVVENGKYLPVLQVLNAVSKVTGLQEKKNSLKVWIGNTTLELHRDDEKVRINKSAFELKAPVRVEAGKWMVPVDFLIACVTPLTHQSVEFQVGSNRVFIGDVRPNSFTVRLDQLANGSRLTLQFAEKVTVRTTPSDGPWVVLLGERPIEPLEPLFRFQDPYVSEVRFDDQDGVPKLIFTPAAGGLTFNPALAEEGRVLLADVVKPAPSVAEQTRPPEPSATSAPPPAPPPTPRQEIPTTPVGSPLPGVVLDAGHGGTDRGSRSRDGVLEKDLVAQLVARVRLELLAGRKHRVVLTRVGDVDQTFEQRELVANLARPVVFLSFHAGEQGFGTPSVVVYTYEPSSPHLSTTPGDTRQLFIPWTQVQQTHFDRSRQLAQALQRQLGQVSGLTADKVWQAPVRTLRSVDAPAVAIEIGSLSPDTDAAALTSPYFQEKISTAIVRALEAFERGTS